MNGLSPSERDSFVESGGWNLGIESPSSSQTIRPASPAIAPNVHRRREAPTLPVARRTILGDTKMPEPLFAWHVSDESSVPDL